MVSASTPVPGLAGGADSRSWLAAHAAPYGEPARALIAKALELAYAHYPGRASAYGRPLIEHALGAAEVIARLNLDPQAVAAALALYLPAAGLAPEDLAASLGAEVARLVEGAGRLAAFSAGGMDLTVAAGKTPLNQAEALRKMLLAMAEDVRVVLLILAEQVQLMRGLAKSDHPAKSRHAAEVREIFAPLANRLGIWQIKWELEDLALRILEPETYHRLARLLDERRVDREAYIGRVVALLARELERAGLRAEVTGRPKHIYSIWRKMKQKGLSFEQVLDVRAVRILVEEVKDCYAALGVVHALWQPIPGEFDDYISHPKPNDYRSLHTAVIGPEGKALEVQIRTREMHHHAEFGVAAHWRYKEGARREAGFDEKIAWLRKLLVWKDELAAGGAEGSEWLESLKTEVFRDRVYVLTPKGKVIDLPQGATPLDFAYAVHTELGHRCRGAKVDGQIVPLTYKLKNAQRVEILAAKQGGPSRDWLSGDYLVTARARAKVRQWFHAHAAEYYLAQGRELLERELTRLAASHLAQEKLAQHFGHAAVEDFLVALGRGDYRVGQIEQAVRALTARPRGPSLSTARQRRPARGGEVLLAGVGSVPVSYGKCCRPVPPDAIVGYVTRARGVVVHRADCSNVTRLTQARQARLVAAEWNPTPGSRHTVEILVWGEERAGLLKEILAVVAAEGASLVSVGAHNDGGLTDVRLAVDVRDLAQLSRLLDELSRVPGVGGARRGP